MSTMTIPAGITLEILNRATRNHKLQCDDCGATALGDSLEDLAAATGGATDVRRLCHRKGCSTAHLSLTAAAPAPVRAHGKADFIRNCRNGESGKYDEADVRLAVSCGALSASDAMNSDF